MWTGLLWFLILSKSLRCQGNEDVTGSPGGFHPKKGHLVALQKAFAGIG